jgi:hypothetical protein
VTLTPDAIERIARNSRKRAGMLARIVGRVDARTVLELGVFTGALAEKLLRRCPEVTDYYMIDPWEHLDDWNKPANKDQDTFESIYQEAMDRTAEFAEKRRVLRGRTVDVIHEIPDGHLDFAYIDGDHTLRGITIDMVKVWDKVRPSGWLAGDDLSPTIWQHSQDWEPTLVFPFAIYFAEAMGCPVYALPFNQFLIEKDPGKGFSFTDLTGKYPRTDLLSQLTTPVS